jgi:hypothetical protein
MKERTGRAHRPPTANVMSMTHDATATAVGRYFMHSCGRSLTDHDETDDQLKGSDSLLIERSKTSQ